MRAWVRAAASSIRSFGMPSSMAWAMPPCPRPPRCAPTRGGPGRGSAARRRPTRPTGRRPGWCPTPAGAAAGCCGRSARRSRSAAPAPRRGRWCAATGCAPGSRPSPPGRCGRRCCRRPARSATSPRSASGCAATATSGSSRRPPFTSFAHSRRAGAELGDLHEEVHADAPEEGQPRRERVDVEAGGLARPQVLDAVGQRVGQLQVGRRPGLLDVVAGDARSS